MIISWETGEAVVREPEAGDEPTPETIEAWRGRVKAPAFNLIRMMQRLRIDGSALLGGTNMWIPVRTPLASSTALWDAWTTAPLIDRDPASTQGISDLIFDTVEAGLPASDNPERDPAEVVDLLWRIAMIAARGGNLTEIDPVIAEFNA